MKIPYATLEDFRQGYKAEHERERKEKGESVDENLDAIIDATFKIGDQDQDGKLSKGEFMALRTVVGNEMIIPFV